MLVVHGVWRTGGRLALWAEDSAAPPARAGRAPREWLHPFAADHRALAESLGETAAKAATGNLRLTLPTRRGVPLDSAELFRAEPAAPGRAAVTLAAWRVAALEFDADQALSVLRELVDDDDRVHGASLRHLAEVAAFAVDLVARGRALPGVAVGPGGAAVALWRPLLTGADATWARSLALALPPSVRAAEPENAAGALLADALDTLTDAAARSVLAGVRLSDDGGGSDAVRAWLRALTGRERSFAARPDALATLVAELHDWQREAAGGAVRACFRLVEPPPEADDGDQWRVEFALQASDEPSLIVGAEQIWASRGGLRALARYLDSPQETLLRELGRASRLWPELDRALRTATPHAVELDTEGAHRFLREGAPVLHAAGFGVLLPSWWQRPSARLGARLHARTRTAPGTVAGRSALGIESLVDYHWEVALGDQPLSAEELQALAALKAPLVRLRGQWVELDPGRLAAALRLLRSGGEMTVSELLRLGLSTSDEPDGLPVLDVSADGPLGDLLAGRTERRLVAAPEPPGFVGRLRPYQKRGLAWLSFLEAVGLGGILADDMGLGKSVMVLALIAQDHPGPTLLVCPTSLVGNWQREAARFTPALRVHVHHGAERPRGEDLLTAVGDADLVLTTYALAARDVGALGRIAWHRIVVDEAQAIKNAATRQAVAVRSLPARHRIAVTGTPMENRLADLWSIMEFVNPGLLGTAAAFKQRYAVPIERHGDEDAVQRLRRITGPFVLRRVKTDKAIISDLPEKLEMEMVCNLTAEQASLYQAVVDDMVDRIERSQGIERRGLVLATMTKLKQVCNHPAHLLRDGSPLAGRSGKLARLEEVLDEVLAAGEKALIFTQYAEFGHLLRARLVARFGRGDIPFLHGGVDKAERDAMVERFQSDAGPPLFLLSLKAGGTGLNLTAANHVVHVDRWWNPAVEDQATDRAFRIGQRRRVLVRKFVCAGTVEEKVSAMIRDKRGLAARIVGTGEQWLTELSTDELRQLFALEDGAVVE